MPDEALIQHYQRLLAEHGEGAAALQYADAETQLARFGVLAQVSSDLGSVIDVGCGLAHLCHHLRSTGFTGRYLGVDIVPDFIERAGRALEDDPLAEVRLLVADEEDLPGGYDYALLSGVFNNVMTDNPGFMRSVLRRMFRASNVGMAFNAMSTYVDYRDEHLYYADPIEVLRFCKEELGGHPVLRHDYVLREGGYPFEYVVYVYREPRLAGR